MKTLFFAVVLVCNTGYCSNPPVGRYSYTPRVRSYSTYGSRGSYTGRIEQRGNTFSQYNRYGGYQGRFEVRGSRVIQYNRYGGIR